MKKVVKAKVCWIPHKKGGRLAPPPQGTKYCPLVFFGESVNQTNNWSADIICGYFDSNLCGIVDFSFLSEKAPYQYLYSGNKFELYEGPKLVARGEIL